MAAARILSEAITVLLVAVVTTPPALAYTASGDRTFPATLVLPQIAPGDEVYFNYSTVPLSGGATRVSDLTATYM
ncbi:MAG: hypothetical protein ACREFB_17360, partial [Stellaceae bacterium]